MMKFRILISITLAILSSCSGGSNKPSPIGVPKKPIDLPSQPKDDQPKLPIDSDACPSASQYASSLHFYNEDLFFYQAGRTDQNIITGVKNADLDKLMELYERCSNKAVEEFRGKEKV